MKTIETLRKIAGIAFIFSGTALAASAPIAGSIFYLHNLRGNGKPLTPDAWYYAEPLAMGSAIFLVGYALRPGKITATGRVFVTAGLLWWLLSGTCYATLYAKNDADLVIGGAYAITSIAALLFGIGMSTREPAGNR